MKSFISVLADYRNTPFERSVVIHCSEDYIQKQMKHLTRKYKKTEAVLKTEKGDIAVLSLESELPKFKRPMVPVTIGGGLFDRELEAALIGRVVNEPFTVEIQGKSVAVTIKKATRTVFPEPTDEMAAAYAAEHDEFAGITTVKEYRDRIISSYCKDQRQQAVYRVMDEILSYVLVNSDGTFDEEEIADVMKQEMEFVQQDLQESEGKDFDHLTEYDLQIYFGVSSYDEVQKVIRDNAQQRIAMALWNGAVHGKDTKESSLEELEELNWEFLVNYAKENLVIKEEK